MIMGETKRGVSSPIWLRRAVSEGEVQFFKNGGFLVRGCGTSLYDSGRSDRRISLGQEGKLLYAARATLGHRFREFSTNSVR